MVVHRHLRHKSQRSIGRDVNDKHITLYIPVLKDRDLFGFETQLPSNYPGYRDHDELIQKVLLLWHAAVAHLHVDIEASSLSLISLDDSNFCCSPLFNNSRKDQYRYRYLSSSPGPYPYYKGSLHVAVIDDHPSRCGLARQGPGTRGDCHEVSTRVGCGLFRWILVVRKARNDKPTRL